MFENNDFFKKFSNPDNETSKAAGRGFMWLIHITKITFLIYSGYHGISATIGYAGTSNLAKAAQIVGIVTLELTLFAIYGAWHNQKVTGGAQSIAAGLTYAFGFTLACLGIAADSQIHAGVAIDGWLAVYMQWGLPLAPAFMAMGGLFTHELAPDQLMKRKRARAQAMIEQTAAEAELAQELANLEMAKMKVNMQLNAQMSALEQVKTWYGGDEAQRAITSTALANAPALLRSIGIEVKDGQLLAASNATEAEESQQEPLPAPAAPKPAPAPAPMAQDIVVVDLDREMGEEGENQNDHPPTLNGVIKKETSTAANSAYPKA